jgi:hypothetical protein
LQARVKAVCGLAGEREVSTTAGPATPAPITLPIGVPVLRSIAVEALIARATLPASVGKSTSVAATTYGTATPSIVVVSVAPAGSVPESTAIWANWMALEMSPVCGFAPAGLPSRWMLADSPPASTPVRSTTAAALGSPAAWMILASCSSAVAKLVSWPIAAEMSLRAC